jgi:hypothetical protein
LPSAVVKEAQQTVRPVAPRVSVESEESTAVSTAAGSKADPLLSRAVKSSMVALGSGGADVDIQIPEFTKGEVAVRLDGRLDEGVWEQVPGYDNMLVMDPDTLADTRYKTDARFFYTDEGLYIGVYMQQPRETLIARLLVYGQFGRLGNGR